MDTSFFDQRPNPIAMSEIETPAGIGLPTFIGGDKIGRVITASNLMDYMKDRSVFPSGGKYTLGGHDFDFTISVQHHCAELKAACLKFDANYMKALGYTKLWFTDLTPGDTQISYEMWGEE